MDDAPVYLLNLNTDSAPMEIFYKLEATKPPRALSSDELER